MIDHAQRVEYDPMRVMSLRMLWWLGTAAMRSQLLDAAFEGDLERLTQLLDCGAGVDAVCGTGTTPTPLHAAIEGEQLECVRLLLSRGADVEHAADGQTPLAHAVDVAIDGTIQSGGKPGDEPTEIVELLLAHGAIPTSGIVVARAYNNRKLLTLLNEAVSKG